MSEQNYPEKNASCQKYFAILQKTSHRASLVARRSRRCNDAHFDPGPGVFWRRHSTTAARRDLTALVRRHHRQRQRQQRDFTKIIINKPPKCYTDSSSSSNSTACSSPCHRKRFKHPVPNSKLMMPLLIKPSEAWRTEGIIIISFFFFFFWLVLTSLRQAYSRTSLKSVIGFRTFLSLHSIGYLQKTI